MSFADKLIRFYTSFKPPVLPGNAEYLFPQREPEVVKIVEKFFNKFYNDDKPRRLILGINPGRFGAGTTGVNFTAPRQLKEFCGIEHGFKENQSELSAEFIYEMINAYGGVKKFYGYYFIGSVSPLGFVKNGLNLNYYDDKELLKAVRPFIIDCIKEQLSMGFKGDHCFCIGGDKNLKFLEKLNEEYHFFKSITPLPHPRFIMQYRRKQKEKYVQDYVNALRIK